jgi:hypothetical protein
MSKVGNEPIAIEYMPWANFDDEFQVGPVSFWSFYEKAEEKIPDPDIRADLTRFFESFVDNMGRPVRTVVACSIGDISFRRLSMEEQIAIRSATDFLIFATITTGCKNAVCSNNNSMAPPSADRFDLCGRWVWPSQDGLVVETENSISFWSHGKYHIPHPISLGGSFCGNYTTLLHGLSAVISPGFPNDVKERLLRSLEWFRFAHTESTSVSRLHKVVMMSTAFEILLDIPDRNATLEFCKIVDEMLRTKNTLIGEREDSKGNKHPMSLPGCWAWDFYKLRSGIVHGDKIDPENLGYKDWITHLIVADLVFRELIMRILYEHKCVGEDISHRATQWANAYGGNAEKFEQAIIPGVRGLDFEGVHKTLGWIPKTQEHQKLHENSTSL